MSEKSIYQQTLDKMKALDKDEAAESIEYRKKSLLIFREDYGDDFENDDEGSGSKKKESPAKSDKKPTPAETKKEPF
jgi:hypothetical protein